MATDQTPAVLAEVHAERARQDAKWGVQDHPDGTGAYGYAEMAHRAKQQCDRATVEGTVSYRHILDEEVAEAFAESDPILLRAELVQVAAVAVAWIEKIDRDMARGGR